MLPNRAALRHIAQRAFISTVSFAFALLIFPSSCVAWDVTGHRYANNLAIDCLSAPLAPLYRANRAWITLHSVDPDAWRRVNFATESPRHFIDLDSGGLDAARTYPEEYWVAAGIVGKEKLDKNGTVPWRIAEYYGKLVRAFRGQDARSIVEISTWLGHYAADAHVPFHATANYDGQSTGQKGIHARFESALLEKFIKASDLNAHSASLIKNPVTSAFEWARASLSSCPEILAADRRAIQRDADYGYNYYSDFAATARPIAIQQLERSGHDIASLWMSAWVEAGRPDLPVTIDAHAGEPLDRPTHDPDLPIGKPAGAVFKSDKSLQP